MKVLLLGSNGMLAQDLARFFSKEELTTWDIADLDITNENEVKNKINRLDPELILNASGYTNVDQAETDKEYAFAVNDQAVGYLVQIAQQLSAILVHISTDYVFGQNSAKGYREDDQLTTALNVYGASKRAGELKILRADNLKYYLVRTSWLFGPSTDHQHPNFVNTIIKLAKQHPQIKIVNDQHGKPTYTFDLAERIKYLVDQKMPSGIYHCVNEPVCTWYEFAKEIVKLSRLTTKVTPCSSQEFPRPAIRPDYSILINTKLPLLSNWRLALKKYLNVKS